MSNQGMEFTQATRLRLLHYLGYPCEWLHSGLYPEDVARLQLKEVLEELHLDQGTFERLPDDRRYGSGSEHFRAAAIIYWLRRSRSMEVTAALKAALASDPDKPMARAFLRELEREKPIS